MQDSSKLELFEQAEQLVFEIQKELGRVLEDIDKYADANSEERLREIKNQLLRVLTLLGAD